ncbi:MAG: peptidoglycan DD-metalloendopeptidase family protein [Patescibacteria group bacterium]
MKNFNSKKLKRFAEKFFTVSILTIGLITLGNFSSFFPILPRITEAATITEIKQNIEQKNIQLEKLNEEIKKLDSQIQEVGKEKQTLQSAVKSLDVSSSKLQKEIRVTENKIGATNLTIEQLVIEIKNKEQDIIDGRKAIAESLRKIDRTGDLSLVEMVLANENIGTFWSEISTAEQFRDGIRANVKNLESLKEELWNKQAQTESSKKNLLSLNSELGNQKKVIDNTKKEKAVILNVTQSLESEYKKQLEEKKRLAEAFASELASFENALRLIIDPTSYPSAGKGILSWPVDSVFVTQYFGFTEFAKQTAAYNGKGHNGIDFRASRGTKIKAALGGVVEGTGNTDAVQGCYSYGKWILLHHDNGLSTLYAHLDLISVVAGQKVGTSDTIGYSGNTGYSTGPHLHFGVYASQGVKILKYENSINCKNAIIPVADLRAYLDPMIYL